MNFEIFMSILVLFSSFPFDSLLDIKQIPMTPELCNEIRTLFLSYIDTSVFLHDLAQHNIKFNKDPNYYKNIIDKFIDYHRELSMICMPRSTYEGTRLEQTRELNSQFIAFIRVQEALIFPPFIQDLLRTVALKATFIATILPSYFYGYTYILAVLKSMAECKSLYIISYHSQVMFVFTDITASQFVALCQSYIPALMKKWGIFFILFYKIPPGLFKNFAGQLLITNSGFTS